jgi:hypothetical protein
VTEFTEGTRREVLALRAAGKSWREIERKIGHSYKWLAARMSLRDQGGKQHVPAGDPVSSATPALPPLARWPKDVRFTDDPRAARRDYGQALMPTRPPTVVLRTAD